MPGGRRYHGRTRTHERDIDNNVDILGAHVKVQEAHHRAVRETQQKDRELETKRDMRNRLRHIYEFWRNEYPEYYAIGVRELTEEELRDPDKFYYNNKFDIIYSGLNVKMVMAFLGAKKVKPNGKLSSHVQLRKYHDAIVWGSTASKEPLPGSYYDAMKEFLEGFKKETASAKKDGMLDEQEADPISWAFFRQILKWAIAEKNVFVWVFSICQWHFMARSINIGVLALHNFQVGEDHGICRYDKTKCDQTGEKVHDKHFYDNPFDSMVSIFLALGVWFATEALHFETTENLFRKDGLSGDAACKRYCNQLSELFRKNKDSIRAYIRVDHANSHGLRKGSGTHASSGTTCPPPVSSIAARGEWSLGTVLDLYWHFAEPGDAYLGRVLSGLDPNCPEFATLPPHFCLDEPMTNEKINEAMWLMYGPVLKKWGDSNVDPSGLLLRCLAAVVWHSDFLQTTIRQIPGHPFSSLPLMNNAALLNDLKELVTLEARGQVTNATGIPPHIDLAITTRHVLATCMETLDEVKEIVEKIKDAVSDAIEQKAIDNGHLTMDTLKSVLESHSKSMQSFVSERIDELKASIPMLQLNGQQGGGIGGPDNHRPTFASSYLEESSTDEVINVFDCNLGAAGDGGSCHQVTFRSYHYGGKMNWHVPKGFAFPSNINLDSGWRLWLIGMSFETSGPDGVVLNSPIRPFRKLKPEFLPPEPKKLFKLHWQPIFRLMEQAPGLEINENFLQITSQDLIKSFEEAREFLRERVSYVFKKEKAQPDTWEISTWSRHVQRSSILKYGTDEDKSYLPPENQSNRPRKQGKRKKKPADKRKIRKRLPYQQPSVSADIAGDGGEDAETGAQILKHIRYSAEHG